MALLEFMNDVNVKDKKGILMGYVMLLLCNASRC